MRIFEWIMRRLRRPALPDVDYGGQVVAMFQREQAARAIERARTRAHQTIDGAQRRVRGDAGSDD